MAVTNYDKTVLLLPFSGSNNGTTFTDYSPDAPIIAVTGDAKTVTAQSQYYGSSGYFDGTGDYLTVTAQNAFIGSGDFGVSYWFRWDNQSLACFIFDCRSSTADANGFAFYPRGTSNTLALFTNNSVVATGTTTLQADTWYHAELNRVSGVIKGYLNGGEEFSYSSSTDFSRTSIRIGTNIDGFNYNNPFWVNDLQVVKGSALHTASFTPPEKLIGSISGTIKDDTNANAIRAVTAVPRSSPSRTFHTTSAADGTYSVTVPNTECSVIVLDDDAGTLYNDIIMRVLPG